MATGWAWLTRDAGEGGTVLAISARGWSPNEPLLPQKFLRYSDADGGRLARQLTARLRAGRVAQRTGLKVEDIVLCQPDSGEMALEVVDQLVRSGVISLIAVDSVAALVPRAEIEGEIGAVQGAPRRRRALLRRAVRGARLRAGRRGRACWGSERGGRAWPGIRTPRQVQLGAGA
jgi:hypothetical protein